MDGRIILKWKLQNYIVKIELHYDLLVLLGGESLPPGFLVLLQEWVHI